MILLHTKHGLHLFAAQASQTRSVPSALDWKPPEAVASELEHSEHLKCSGWKKRPEADTNSDDSEMQCLHESHVREPIEARVERTGTGAARAAGVKDERA